MNPQSQPVGVFHFEESDTTDTGWNEYIGETTESLYHEGDSWILVCEFKKRESPPDWAVFPAEHERKEFSAIEAAEWLRNRRIGLPDVLVNGPDPSQRIRCELDGEVRVFDPSTASHRWGPSLLTGEGDRLYRMPDGTYVAVRWTLDAETWCQRRDIAILTRDEAVNWIILHEYEPSAEMQDEFARRYIGTTPLEDATATSASASSVPASTSTVRTSPKSLIHEWLARAMLTVSDHPDWSDADIARSVGKSPSTLSRNDIYQVAAGQARANMDSRPKGFRTSGGDIEAVSPKRD